MKPRGSGTCHCGAGVPPAVAGASRSRMVAQHGRDARATAGETPAPQKSVRLHKTRSPITLAGCWINSRGLSFWAKRRISAVAFSG